MDQDALLFKSYLEGDESAFDKLMEGLFFRLVYFVDGIVHDTFAAEDIAVDVFAELVASPKRFDGRAGFKTFVFMMGKSRALNYLKHRKVVEFTELSEAEGLAAERSQLEEKVLHSERQRVLAEAIAQLPEQMRQAVHLVYFEGLSYAQAAKAMDMSAKYVDNMLQRAKKQLAGIIGEEGRELL